MFQRLMVRQFSELVDILIFLVNHCNTLNPLFRRKSEVGLLKVINKGKSSIPLFESHKSIEKRNKSGLQTKSEGNTTTIQGKSTKQQTQNTKDNAAHTATNYMITTAIFLTWYRTF